MRSLDDKSVDDGECESAGVKGLLLLLPLDEGGVGKFDMSKLLLDGQTKSSHGASGIDGICGKGSCWNADAETVDERLRPELGKLRIALLVPENKSPLL